MMPIITAATIGPIVVSWYVGVPGGTQRYAFMLFYLFFFLLFLGVVFFVLVHGVTVLVVL